MTEARVLCVDDEPGYAALVAERLERERPGFDARAAEDADAALEALAEESVDCVVSDYEMPGASGLELLDAVRERDPDLPFVLFTGRGSEDIASEAISRGVTDYLRKSTGGSVYEVLANRVENAVERYRADRAAERERELLETVLVASPVGIVVHEADGTAVLANDRARELLGVEGDDGLDVEGYQAADWRLLSPDGDPVPTERLPARRTADAGDPVRGLEYVLESADGRRRPLYANAVPLREDGEVTTVVVAFGVPPADGS